jgi:segregation and condensation protein A
MIEKPVPWWRKVLNYALSGIRSGFGLFPKPAKPASLETSSPEKDRFLNSPEPTLGVEEAQELREPLTNHPANPETVFPVAESVIEPVAANVIEPAPAAAPAAAPDRDPGPINEIPPADEIAPASEIVFANEIAPAEEIAPSDEIIPADEIESQPPSQTAEKRDPEGGGGFNPRIEPTETTWAGRDEFQPIHLSLEAMQPHVVQPEPIVELAPVDEPAPAADPVPNIPEAEPVPEPVAEHEPIVEPTPPIAEEAVVEVQDIVVEEVIVAGFDPRVESIQLEEPSQAVFEDSPSPTQEIVPAPAQPVPPDPVEPDLLPPASTGQPAETTPPVEAELAIKPDVATESLPEPINPPTIEPVAEAASIAEPLDQETAAGPFAIADPISANVPAPDPAPVPSAAQPAPDPIAYEKAAAKLAARQKKLDDAAELSPFSVIVGQVYTGPLDLLLDLIRQQDIDIYDIPIAKITAQFLAYVNQLKATDVDVAGEFIYTASLLIHIKSKMLLPRSPAGPDDTPEDPRRELVERLLEHERFKNAAQMLQQKQMLEAATWTNPGFREFQDDEGAEPEIAADTVDLVRIFRDILERARNRPVIDVQEDSVTVGQMIQFLARRLTMEDKPIALRRLHSHTRSERALVAMFLALLELVRLQAVLLRQDRAFSDIFIKKHTGFDAVMNQGLANALDDWR